MGHNLSSSMVSPAVSANPRSLTTNEAQQQERVAQASGLNQTNRNLPIVLLPRYRMLPISISRILSTRISILSPIATPGQLMRSTTILEGRYSTTFVMMKRASLSAIRSYLHMPWCSRQQASGSTWSQASNSLMCCSFTRITSRPWIR